MDGQYAYLTSDGGQDDIARFGGQGSASVFYLEADGNLSSNNGHLGNKEFANISNGQKFSDLYFNTASQVTAYNYADSQCTQDDNHMLTCTTQANIVFYSCSGGELRVGPSVAGGCQEVYLTAIDAS